MAKAKRTTFALKLEAVANMSAIKKANQNLRDLNRQVSKMQPLLNLAKKGLLGLAGAAYGFKALAQSANQLGQEVAKLATATGASTTDLQVLGRVAATNGAKLEDMSKALLALTKNTEAATSGNQQLAERYARLGIDLQNFKTLSPERQMERLGLAVNAASDKQAALADIMGLVGTDSAPKLMAALQTLGTEGYDQLKSKALAAGQVMSEESIKALAAADQHLADFGHRMKLWAADWTEGASLIYQAYIKSDKLLDTAEQAMSLRRQFDGVNNPRAVEAALQAGSENIKSGATRAAKFWAKESAAWVENARAHAEKYPTGPQAALVAQYDSLLKAIATKDAARAAHHAAIERGATEAKRVQEQSRVALAAEAAKAEQALKVQKAKQAYAQLAKEDAAFQKIRENILSHIEQEEEAAWAAQLRAAETLRDTLAAAAHDALAPSEQLRAQAEQFHAQVAALGEQSLLTTAELTAAQSLYNEKLREADALLSQERDQAAYADLGDSVKDLLGEFERLDGVVENQLSGTLKTFVETGTADMKKLGQSILNEVIQSMLKALVLKPLLSGLGGMFGGAGGGIFSSLGGAMGLPGIPGRASGGPVRGGSPYLVGEKGPELFLPPTSGTIIDANKTASALAGDTATGGDTGPQNIYHIDARGADAGAVTRLEHALLKLAGPGVVERRATAAHAERTRRG